MSRHLVIIGGGIIGLSTAYYSAKRGFRVTLIERSPAVGEGCSFGNAGLVVPSHFIPLAAPGVARMALKWMWNPGSPFHVKPRLDAGLMSWGWKFLRASTRSHVLRCAPLIRDLSFASRECFEALAGTLDFGFASKGLVMLCTTRRGLDEEAKVAAMARELGVPAEVLDARATAALDPGVRMDIAGSVFFPKDCHLSPERLMSGLRAEATRAGVVFENGTTVAGWHARDRRIEAVRTDRGDFTADEYVLCGGAWSQAVARDLRIRLPMQAGKGYTLTLGRPRQTPRIPAIFSEARVAVTPMPQTDGAAAALRFGGTMEFAGLDGGIDPRRVSGIIDAVCRYYPDFTPADFAGIQAWAGLRPCSPDGLPYIGRTAAYENLSVATGHAMMGLSLGPITGRLMAELLSGDSPSLDLRMLSPDRYATVADRS